MTEKSKPKAKRLNLDDAQHYINRELSMITFQERVFEEVEDTSNPLLERIKFLAIVGSNMDAFYMVRVGGLKLQAEAGIPRLSIDGQTPAEQLAAIRKQAAKLMASSRDVFHQSLVPELDAAGIHILNYEQLDKKQKSQVDAYFQEVVFPVLTPLAFDPGHPFPHISNLSLNLAVVIRDDKGQERFARVKVPTSLPRLVPIKRSSGGVRKDGTVPHNHYFVWLEQLIAHHLDSLFPGMTIKEYHPFRVTRHVDASIDEFEGDDLLAMMEQSVRQRRFGSVVRLGVHKDMPDGVLRILLDNLNVDENQVYRVDPPLGLASLMELHNIDRFDLKDESFLPYLPPAFSSDNVEESVFAAIRQGDILMHHPYESFDAYVHFLRAAARDPNVLAIKHTLYRVGKDSPVVQTLLEARREYGKQVAVLVELKARFDEENNIEWAKRLENEGVHVTYGLMNLKTHSKVSLVVRQEGDHIRRYVHLSTGNYNHVTARLYEDLALFTSDARIGADATDLFNYLTGYSSQKDFRDLLIAPVNLRQNFEKLIKREMKHAQEGRPAHLIFKMNALVDKGMIRRLYEASAAGVKIELIVRGMCSLRPGVPGLSETISVRSILGRFLEHSRIYYFANGGQEEVYVGSADLMDRNLNDRVEAIFPVKDAAIRRRIKDEILRSYLADTVKARIMDAEGRYTRPNSENGREPYYAQGRFLAQHR